MDSNREQMQRLAARAHFDGRQIVLDERLELAPGTPLIVSVVTKEMVSEQSRLSAAELASAYSDAHLRYGPQSGPNRSFALLIGVVYLMTFAEFFRQATNWPSVAALVITICGAAIVMAALSALGVRFYHNQGLRIRFKFSTLFLASIPFSVYLAAMRVFVQRAAVQQFGLAETCFLLIIGLFWMFISTVILLGFAEALVAIAVGLLRWRNRMFPGSR